VGLIVDAENPLWRWAIPFTMPDNDVVEIDARTMTVSRYYPRLGTINLGLAVRPFTSEIYVANTEARNKERFEPVLRARFVQNRVSRVRPLGGGRTIWELNGDQPARETSLAQPTAMVFDPLGRFLFVAAFGTDRVGVLNPDTGAVLARIPVGPVTGSDVDPRNKRGPRGLALHSLSPVLYVLNRISNTISVVNTQARAEVAEIPVGSFDPTPAVIRNGRGFLYDAKLSGNGSGSCVACHIDADMDMLAWDLGDPGGDMSFVEQAGVTHPMHPMKGPLTTQSLRGLADSLPLHWRGDRADFNAFNGAFSSLMGGSTLPDDDMKAFTAFINTVRYMPNPNQNLDRTLPDSLNGGNPNAGRATFLFDPYKLDIRCNSCHFSTPGPGSNGFIQNFEGQDQPVKVAQLRNVYQKTYYTPVEGGQSIGGFGLLNDGTVANPFVLFSQRNFGRFSNDTVKKQNLSAFVMCFDTGTAPAVGYSRTVRADNLNDLALLREWITLQFQAAAGNIDLTARGMIDGQLTGLLYRPATNDYVPDTQADSPVTRAQLVEFIRQGGILTVMGVPPGSGRRIGIDRDMDGIPDRDDQ
jgi:YVTN family beta-propeller protein